MGVLALCLSQAKQSTNGRPQDGVAGLGEGLL